ncbi:inter-alpha-trypsin inhibitor heavy chain H3-like [Mugil cephalus]|uniref:inter-alpha-trypsin inhibitor heavy chain H3-like n=1 Tax=Mugil cephalus TaxID=48193 RepID=UPI001FB79848|nr:inter-alpha-trypsin inhibitor heavy chain H3-like [Mugil cephalus]
MERTVLRVTLFGLLLVLAYTLPNKDDWDIYSFHINSTVTSRYATTVISSRVANRMDEPKEIEFHVRIPKNAFISRFKMFIDGQVYDGLVKAKEQAQQQYTEAVLQGQSAGIVSSVGRTMEEFKTSVNVAAHKKVTFELTYEELMKRTHGKYELQIHARPMQPVKDFKVDVYIHEKAGISFIDVKGGLSTAAMANAITKTHTDKQAWVHFYPTEEQQKTCDSCSDQGMNGDLVIVYDVNRGTPFGEIQTSDGYFVHHFAPSNLPKIPKNFVFVADKSGSMQGRKIEQTRTALLHILKDLSEDDFFGLISFDSNIFYWKRELVQATKENIDSAKVFVQGIYSSGATNINDAVLQGARMLNTHPREGSAPILILLTDGDPTAGETNLRKIHSNVKKSIAGKFPLYCLGFGFDVNFEFLEKMSLENNGVARRIYEDSDADIQLKDFYEEVATPLLMDVAMTYTGGTNLTQTKFSQYYNGSEIVVAGQILDNNIETFIPQVVGISRRQNLTFSDTRPFLDSTEPSDSIIQRVWAYLTVKQLLDKELQLSGPEKEKVKTRALELSLNYSFVTPLTSMVVTKPPGESTDVLNKPKEGGPAIPEGRFGSRGTTSRSSGRIAGHGHRGTQRHSHRIGGGGGHWTSLNRGFGRAGMIVPAHGGVGADYSLPVSYSLVFHSAPIEPLRKAMIPSFAAIHPTHTTAVGPDPLTTESSVVGLSVHRFLLKTESQLIPLCYDLDGDLSLKLFHYPSSELYVNGELDSIQSGGFRRIVIHFKSDQHVEVNPKGVSVTLGQTVTNHTGQDPITAGSMTVIRRDKETDVTAGDMRMVILLHQKDGEEFLWPVIRQRPSANDAKGILALEPAVYVEIQQGSDTKLMFKGQEFDVKRTTAADYSITVPQTLDCWLMSSQSVLQGTTDEFLVQQL